ncbi:15413_t:CDS:2 [Cetraspora pellucida]|uniref:15413_t:CDS:1 n=1 Tax=Cetraspora pellucida TaxID=1433469 RepID=A0ACA9M7W8_9GLOM|nr:15413_t:CDS:2 [Cetraspora pellucida]
MSNNPSHQIQESTESNSEDSIKHNVNLDALQKSASNMKDGNKYIGRVAFPVYSQ